MSISSRPVPVSEVLADLDVLTDTQQVIDLPVTRGQETWGRRMGLLRDRAGNNLPPYGGTVFFSLDPGGMIDPVRFMPSTYTARLAIDVLAGRGTLIRAFNSGATGRTSLEKSSRVEIQAGQAMSVVNTGEQRDENLVLRAVATPAVGRLDLLRLVSTDRKSERLEPVIVAPIFNRDPAGKITGMILIERSMEAPERFYSRLDEIAAGRVEGWIPRELV